MKTGFRYSNVINVACSHMHLIAAPHQDASNVEQKTTQQTNTQMTHPYAVSIAKTTTPAPTKNATPTALDWD